MTMDEKTETSTMVEHERALKVYIDALLLEPALETSVEEKVDSSPTEIEIVTEQQSDQALEQHALKPDISSLSDEVLECLLFKVAGFLTLAVPLVRLNGIMQWNGDATHIPGHADWFLGLVSNRGQQVKVIDIAKFVIPENHKSRQSVEGERNFKHMLLIDDGKIGLACDELGQVVKISHEKVRWREDRSSRPWLAGTLIEQMSALLDVEKFTEMLKDDIPLDEIS